MSDVHELAHELGLVPDLKSLLARARALGVGHLLEQPLEALYEVPELGRDGAALLDDIADLGTLPTVGELVSDHRIAELAERGATVRQRRALRAAVVAHVVRVLADGRDHRGAAASANLADWAAENDVTVLLDTPLRALDGVVEVRDRRWLYLRGATRVTIRDLFEPRRMTASGIPPAALASLQRAARRFLEREVENRRAALVEEAERLARRPPRNPVARALRERLLGARADVRALAQPRGRNALPRITIQFDADPPTLVVIEEQWPHRPTVRLPLQTALPSDPLAATCTCSPRPPARCAHVLTAIDLFLDRLDDPRSQGANAAILAELERPAWARALADLEAQLAPAPATESIGVTWRLQRRGDLLAVMPALQRPTKGGGRSRGSKIRASDLARSLPPGASPADREAAILVAMAERLGINSSRHLVTRAVQALVGHPGVTLAEPPCPPVTVRAGAVTLAVVDHPAGGVVLEPRVDGVAIDPGVLARSLDPDDEVTVLLDETARVCTVVKIGPELKSVLAVLVRRGGAFPADAVSALSERLPALAERVCLSLPPSLRGDEVPAETRPVLQLEPQTERVQVRVRVRPLAGGSAHAPGEGPAEIVGWRDGHRVHARRDLAAEAARVRRDLATLPLPAEAGSPTEPFAWTLDRGEPALDLLAALRDAEGAYIVEWAGEPQRVTRPATTADLRVRIEDKRDWFGVSGGIDVDGLTVPLADVLEAMRARQRYVEVKGGLWLRLGDELRARLEPASDLVGHGRAGLEVSSMAAPVLADLIADQADAPRRLRELLARIRKAGERVPEPPDGLGTVLRDYQLTGFRWLARLAGWGAGACLADDMGLGKTVQALALLGERASLGPALVVAPTSVAWNWVRETHRFAPSLRPILYGESDRSQARSQLAAGDVLVVSYGLLARDVEELARTKFATLVLDEAQAIKNPATQRARAAAALQADFRVALTGTPVENRLAELWSLFRVVVPGLLGSWERFRDRFATPIERDDDAGRRAALARLVRPFILRRMKSEVAPELPARTEIREDVTLSPPERALYDDLRRAVLAELAAPAAAPERGPERRFQILAAMTRLRQLACHPRLVDGRSSVPSAKLERCLELVDELREGGHRALIFSQFTSHLALLREALDSAEVPYLYLDGQTPAGRRKELVDAFQGGEGDLFLISLKAGGTGLNLTGADYVIHLDPWWNPAVEDQATDRAHRIGQERPVTVYRLVARETIEEAILDLHGDKRRLVAGILDGTGTSASISTEELMKILRAGA